MAIIVKKFTWNETETDLFVMVNMRGVTANKLDVFISDSYVKLNSHPFFWELFLPREIISERSHIRVENGTVNLSLVKADVGLWKEISVDDVTDKNLLMQRRKEKIAEHKNKTKESERDKSRKKLERNRDLVSQQIKVEEDERKKIELEKQKLKCEALKQILTYEDEDQTKEIGRSGSEREIPLPRTSSTIRVRFTSE